MNKSFDELTLELSRGHWKFMYKSNQNTKSKEKQIAITNVKK